MDGLGPAAVGLTLVIGSIRMIIDFAKTGKANEAFKGTIILLMFIGAIKPLGTVAPDIGAKLVKPAAYIVESVADSVSQGVVKK